MAKQRESNLSFTDGKPFIATEHGCKARWGGGKPGVRFRCYLCGHKFVPGDQVRFVMSKKYQNFFVCAGCDVGDDTEELWTRANEEARRRFWWLFEDLASANEDVRHESRLSYDAGFNDGRNATEDERFGR